MVSVVGAMPARIETSAQRARALRSGRGGESREDYARRMDDPVYRRVEQLRGTSFWRAVRDQVRSRDPLCVLCLASGRTEATVDIDHVVSARAIVESGDERMFYDPANLRGLCRSCHATKSAEEARGVRDRTRRGGGFESRPHMSPTAGGAADANLVESRVSGDGGDTHKSLSGDSVMETSERDAEDAE
jgi:5-methylcytosine-specific restriction endonuclease McrA